ncbi:YbaK/EbsC family protein [Sphingomonas sp. RB56-2]|uniref:YbaK/EbsC family protein n=1 Tax=Sphingomonas brevis TaxID=2908206 RepID=A0ABT0S8I8_9SPHN|nr:YbaK/EbsC family protein [Sphingomonas brevis]MCL6740444.1 YbaK/EbsC family protein [Sphingomonas brevis]
MSIAPKLQQFLDEANADYELVEHQPTKSSLETAKSCDVPADRLAKSILLDTDDGPLLAVLPSDRKVELSELRSELGHKPRLAGEAQLQSVFTDCDFGAVPPVGYGVTTIIDDSIGKQSDVYFEAGDRQSLVHMDRAEFSRVTEGARHGQFSEPSLVD